MPVESATKRGFAVFEGRVIYEAQKPITSEQLAAIEAQIGCAVPAGLRALWETTFGGRVGYDLEIEFGGHVASFSFNEIFFPGGDTYRDLPERIDYERELAEEAGHTGPLRFLPFGGFEYLDRLYVGLTAPHEGAVFAWMQGLPSAWALRLHNVSVGRIADAVPTLFRLLAFKQDPFGLGDTYNAGHEMAGAIEALDHTDGVLGDTLQAVVRSAVLDWRGTLGAETLARDTRLRRLAFQQIAATGDLALADRMGAQAAISTSGLRAAKRAPPACCDRSGCGALHARSSRSGSSASRRRTVIMARCGRMSAMTDTGAICRAAGRLAVQLRPVGREARDCGKSRRLVTAAGSKKKC